MKWYSYLICFLLICLGSFSLIRLSTILNTESADYGTVITLETKNNYEEISKFDFGDLDLSTDNKKTFTSSKSFEPQEFNGTAGNYTLLFDDNIANNVKTTNGSISGNFNIVFYGISGEVLSTAILNIQVIYTASETKVLLSIDNNNNSVSYLNIYSNLNGSVFKVVERGA